MTAPPAPASASEAAPRRGWLGPLHVTGVFWYRLHCWAAAKVPRWLKAVLVPLWAGFFFLVLPATRRGIAGNLEPVLGPCGFWVRQARIWRTLRTFAWCLTERYEHLSGSARLEFMIEGEDDWRAVAASGTGFVLVTAHVGHWEAASGLPGGATGRKVHVVREDEMDPRARTFIRELLARRGGPTLETHFVGEDLGLALRLVEALRAGEIVAVQGDRPRQSGRALAVQIFGRRAAFPEGPAAIARAADVPLVPVFAFRERRRVYRVVVRPPVRPGQVGDRRNDIAAATQELAGRVEWAIRSRPHQWFCFRQIWI